METLKPLSLKAKLITALIGALLLTIELTHPKELFSIGQFLGNHLTNSVTFITNNS